jgi:hypothetical protein
MGRPLGRGHVSSDGFDCSSDRGSCGRSESRLDQRAYWKPMPASMPGEGSPPSTTRSSETAARTSSEKPRPWRWLVDIARAKGVSGYVGDGANRWPAVHRLDAARLFRLALEKAPAGSSVHATADEGVPIRDIAEVIGRHLRLPVASIAPKDAADHFAWLAGLLAVDALASSAITRKLLGFPSLRGGHRSPAAARLPRLLREAGQLRRPTAKRAMRFRVRATGRRSSARGDRRPARTDSATSPR